MNDVNEDLGALLAQQSGADPHIEAEAREQGWVPADEWQGNPDDWRDAASFVEKGKQVTAIMRKKLQGKDREIQQLIQRLGDTSATVAELRDYIANVEQKAYERAVANIKAQRKDALANGDFAGAAELEDQLDNIKEARSSVPEVKDKPAPKADESAAAAGQVHPDVARWMQSNPWFHEDNQDAVDFANGRALSLVNKDRAAGVTRTPSEILDAVTVDVKRRFPELFDAGAAMFDTSSGGGRGGPTKGTQKAGGKGFNSLPADAKAQFQRFYDQNFYTVKGDKNKKMPLAEAQAEYFSNYS